MTTRYTRTAMVLHWLIAVLIIGLFCFGLYMVNLPLSPTKLQFYSWHKWAGVTIFVLVCIRLGWRLTNPAPPLPASQPAWLQLMAHGGHILLYVLMLALPLSGWLMSSAKGFQTVWFGVLPLPDLLPKNETLGDQLLTLHVVLAFSLILVAAGHTVMALKHHFVDRDDTLKRMLPGRD